MSTVVHPKGHRHTRSAAMPPNVTLPNHPQNPHHLSLQAQAQVSRSAMDYPVQPSTPPRTPRRDNGQLPQNKTISSAQETGSKQKPRKKKSKNVMTSPAATGRIGHSTPSTTAQSTDAVLSAKPISTPSTTAYAGPTFHASPAPSALPIPSFYSKSVPESPGIKGLKPLKEPSSPDSTTPPPLPMPNLQFHREESPLDIFFRADREEKARARSASSSQTTVAASGPFHPPTESLRASQTPPASTSQTRPRHASKLSSSGIFTMELDGSPSPGTPFGPAFSTPYSERINAARSQLQQTSSDPSMKGGQATSTSEALKAYLFSSPQNSSSRSSSGNPFGGSSIVPSTTATASADPRNSSHFGGSRRNQMSSFAQPNNYPGSHDFMVSSAHAPKTSGRPSSGLRQEVAPTGTPTKTPDRNANFATTTALSQRYGQQSKTNDFTSTQTRDTSSPLPASPYSAPSGNNSGDLKGMEDSLRKILKLDSAGSSGTPGQAIDRVTAAAVSVPSYVGGRDLQ